MESTGIYWKPIFNILEDSFEVILVNARHLKNVPGRKTDRIDSQWICKLLLGGLLKASYVPEEKIRQLRDLSRYSSKMVQQLAAEKNRLQKILEDANIKLSSVVSDTSGVVATRLIDGLIAGRQDIAGLIAESYHGRLKASQADLLKALTGRVTDHHRFMLRQIKKHMAWLETEIGELEAQIDKLLEQDEESIELLTTIPGVDKANKYLKAVLVEAAWAATRTKGTYLRAKYESMVPRKGRKKALLIVGHKILCAVYHILNTHMPYGAST